LRTAAICPTCAEYFNALCILYDGEYLTNIDVSPLDSLEDILEKINNNLVPLTGSGAPATTPIFIGQEYIDTDTGDIYYGMALNSSADWYIGVQVSTTTTTTTAP
jgi:hypothetical protein